jgi:hypothetical protein
MNRHQAPVIRTSESCGGIGISCCCGAVRR